MFRVLLKKVICVVYNGLAESCRLRSNIFLLSVFQMHSQESTSPDGARSTEIVIDINGDRILITADGYYPGIEAIIRKVGAIMTENGIEAFKWAGGCTLTEQPADVAGNHANIHKAAASDTFRDDEDGAPM